MQEIYRLKKNNQFDYVFRKGKSAATELLVLFYAPNRSGKLKVGFSVSKKVGKAVYRNLVKRRLKEAFRKEIPTLNPNYNYVVLARNPADGASFAALSGALHRALKKSGLIQKV